MLCTCMSNISVEPDVYLFYIYSSRSSIGIKLLKKMGWKEGQGVGPRVKRRARRLRGG